MIIKVTLHKYNIDSDDAEKDFFKIMKTMNICQLIKYLYISFKHLDYLVEDIFFEFLPSPFYNFFLCKIDCKRKHLKFQQIVCIPVCKFSCIKLCTSLIFLLTVFYQVYTGICRYKYF